MRLPRLETISSAWFLTLGLTALAAGVLVYILLLESALGAFSIREASPANIGVIDVPRVALLGSDYTRQLGADAVPPDSNRADSIRSDSNDIRVDRTLLSWREYLINQDPAIPFRDIDDKDLESGDLSEFDVLILPSVRALSDVQIERIHSFMERGGSILATWATGVYREDGSWRGWSFAEQTFGVEFEGFAGRDEFNFQVSTDTFPGTTPPGLYLSSGAEGTDMRRLSPDTVREDMRALAREADFAPLTGFVWHDSLQAAAPPTDFARARPVRASIRGLDGQLRERDATVVTWYTWIGARREARIPFARTGSGIRRFTLRGNTPLTAGIPSGYRMKIQIYNPGVKVSIREPDRVRSAGFWFDFATDDLVSMERVRRSTGLVYGRYGTGRFVYMGFQRDAMGVGPEDSEDERALEHFFHNGLNYLRRLPTIWVNDWPGHHRAAAMITGIARSPETLPAFDAIGDLLESEGIPGTWFVDPSAAAGTGDLLERLHASGDVGVTLDTGAEADGTLVDLEVSLRQARTRLEAIVHGRVTGFRPSRAGAVSERTMSALVDADYAYFMPDSIGRVVSPRIMGDGFGSLIRIGTTAYGPADHARVLNGVSQTVVNDLLQSDIARVRHEGGLYNLVLDPEAMPGGRVDSAAVDMIRTVARSVRDGDFWLAAGREVALWWRLYRNIDVDVEARSRSRLYVRVSNNNGYTADDVRVSIDLGRPVQDVDVRPELINVFRPIPDERDRPPYTLSTDGTILELSIRRLKPQQYRIFHIDLLGRGVHAETEATPSDTASAVHEPLTAAQAGGGR